MPAPTDDSPTISLIIPTYRREQVLIDTLRSLQDQLVPGDEILVIDQSPQHAPDTQQALEQMASEGLIRWFRKRKPNQCEAMNTAAHLAKGEILLFLDDDIIPSDRLVDAHRSRFADAKEVPATCGQVLQPWNETAVNHIAHFDYRFDAAYAHECDIVSLMAGNFAIRRETFLGIGGMDENFQGANYRSDAEIGHRILRRTSRKVHFVPDASLRHLLASGGNRAHGFKDTWGNLGSRVGDYYFAIRSLPFFEGFAYCAWHIVRSPVCRNTVRQPWVIPSLFLREIWAIALAAWRVCLHSNNYIKKIEAYSDLTEVGCPDICHG